MMHPMRIVAAMGAITRLWSFTLLVPVLVAFAYEPWAFDVGPFAVPRNALVFIAAFGATALFWGPVTHFTRDIRREDMQDREAYLTVGIGWLVLSGFAMLPFILSGVLVNPIDAFFEAMSGFTTTGATVIEGRLDALPKSVMFWRSGLQFLGGMGIIVLSVALLARLSTGGTSLFTAEAPGTTVTRIQPKLAQTAKALWKVYISFAGALAAILLALLLADGFAPKDALYEAIMHTFTTLSTGGFSNHSASISYFDNWLLEAVIILFMLVAGTNFTLLHYGFHGRPSRLLRDPEWRFYILIFFAVTLAVTGILVQAGQSALGALRGASFTVASLLTSTGYATADYDTWPDAAKFLILAIMATGGSLGSTAGGLKVVRILILLRLVRQQIRQAIYPRAVIPVRMAGRPVKEDTLMLTTAFFFSFVALWIGGAVILVLTDPALDLVDSVATSLSATSNMGPALGETGPTRGYWDLQPHSKVLLSLLMWAGRLEIFTALLIFNPATWRH